MMPTSVAARRVGAIARHVAAGAETHPAAAAADDPRSRYAALRERLLRLETSVVCDADKVNEAAHPTGLGSLRLLDPGIYPLNDDAELKMVGIAFTVRCDGDEFLTVLHALSEAEAGDVLMIDAGGASRAKAGEIFAKAALGQGLAGIVVDGAARDSALIRTLPLPYYVRSVTPAAGSTSDAYGEIRSSVTVGGCTVNPCVTLPTPAAACAMPGSECRCHAWRCCDHSGDVVFGDADGVLVGSLEAFEAVVEKAEAIAAGEEATMARLDAGEDLSSMMSIGDVVERVKRQLG